MPYQFILTDLLGVTHGELTQASERRVTDPHMRVPSASCTIPLAHPLASTVMDTDCLLQAWRIDPVTSQRDCLFNGPIITAEETGQSDEQTIAIAAAGPYWRVAKRLIPGSLLTTGVAYGSSGGLIDLGTIARTILTDVNGVHFTGIDLGTQVATTTGWVGTWFLKNAAEAIAELAAGLNTFEYRVRPTAPTAYANPNNWPRIGLFDVAPTLGSSRPDAIFEYGAGRANVASYGRVKSREGILTRAQVAPPGWPDGVERNPDQSLKYNLVTKDDLTAINARGLFEEQVNDAGVLDATLRGQIGDYHVALRKQPRETITFTVAPNARPAPKVDYDVGDTVRARGTISGSVRFDALFRVWGITYNVDANGTEQIELELVRP